MAVPVPIRGRDGRRRLPHCLGEETEARSRRAGALTARTPRSEPVEQSFPQEIRLRRGLPEQPWARPRPERSPSGRQAWDPQRDSRPWVRLPRREAGVARFAFPPCPLGPPQGWGWVTLIPSPPPGRFSVLLFTLESPSFYLFIFFGGEAASQLLSYCDLSFPGGACDSPGCWASGAIVYRRPRRDRSGLLASTSRPQRGGRGGHAGAGVTPRPPGRG